MLMGDHSHQKYHLSWEYHYYHEMYADGNNYNIAVLLISEMNQYKISKIAL